MSRSSIAETLKSKRKDAGLTVDAVCKRLEEYDIRLSKNSMYNYESGYRQPDADTLMALCEIYEIVDILDTFGYKSKDLSDLSCILAPDEQQLVENYRSLNRQGQEATRQHMELLVESKRYKKSCDIPNLAKEA